MDETGSARLLLVDNDEEFLAALRVRLTHAGYECESAVSGAQAYVAAASDRFDLIVTDLQMPGGDGACLVNRIREHSPIPIIVVTGFADAFEGEIARMPNVRVIQKPFDVDCLIEMIESQLAIAEECGHER